MPDLPSDAGTYSDLVLSKIKVVARQQLSAQVAHDTELRSWLELMTDRMVFELRSHIYAHKVDAQEVRVPFSVTETAKVPAPRRLLWAYLLVTVVGVVLTATAESWPAFAVACASALAFVVVHVSNPPGEVTVVAQGEVVVTRDQFNAFPDNSMVYPDHLGGAVRIAMQSPPDVRYTH